MVGARARIVDHVTVTSQYHVAEPPPTNATVTATVHRPGAAMANAMRPAPAPTATAPAPVVASAGARTAVQGPVGVGSTNVTASGSPAPTAIGAPGSHGLSEPPIAPGE